MGAAAVAAAEAVNYLGAGTVEFIVERCERGVDFFFMEMNTRLQVEHPVTEAVNGFGLGRVAVAHCRWRSRCRLTQDAGQSARPCHRSAHLRRNPWPATLLPAIGRLQVMRTPNAQRFVRLARCGGTAGCSEGDAISPHYDSMIAKLIVHGDTREQALARLDQALCELHIVGVANNVAFLRHVARRPSFATGPVGHGLDRARERRCCLTNSPCLCTGADGVGGGAQQLGQRASRRSSGWHRPVGPQTDGWRVQGMAPADIGRSMHADTLWQAQWTTPQSVVWRRCRWVSITPHSDSTGWATPCWWNGGRSVGAPMWICG
jgi:3-methylcrotonyl-CoA carboxylase alpha subunit